MQPGIFGGPQARPAALDDAVNSMKSKGPDGQDHKRHANALTFDDTKGKEVTYLQAQKDLRLTAKNDILGSAGGNRAFMVLGNDYEEMPNGYQVTKVAKDRSVEVTGMQQHTVKGDVVLQTESNQVNKIKQNLYTETTEGGQVFQSKAGFLLRVADKAAIVMTPSAIVIDAQKVFINPGPDVMKAIYAGASPEQAVANAEREDRINAAAKALVDKVKSQNSHWTDNKSDPATPAQRAQLLDPNAKHQTYGRSPSSLYNSPYHDVARDAGAQNDGEIAEAGKRANAALP